ncbi:MAG TPA: ATP-dependent Clp protease proteolytic subunit [Candidatus Paceibacterota bacterium]|nr:ATP-dependent Clp protease proteolytic subunit [Candidatus Paceibacterota bacterium]
MSSIIPIYGEINEQKVAEVKSCLQRLKEAPHDKELIFKFNSEGGNMESMEKIKTFMYFMNKKQGYTIIGRMIYAESAALLLFLNCEERQVTKDSIGVIHMATLNREYDLNKLKREREDQANFIVKRCKEKISLQQVFDLEGKKLGYQELLDLGFANKLVETFTLAN